MAAPSMATSGSTPAMACWRNASCGLRRSSSVRGASTGVRPAAAASSSTAPRVTPGSAPSSRGGVTSSAPRTMDRLLALPSPTRPPARHEAARVEEDRLVRAGVARLLPGQQVVEVVQRLHAAARRRLVPPHRRDDGGDPLLVEVLRIVQRRPRLDEERRPSALCAGRQRQAGARLLQRAAPAPPPQPRRRLDAQRLGARPEPRQVPVQQVDGAAPGAKRLEEAVTEEHGGVAGRDSRLLGRDEGAVQVDPGHAQPSASSTRASAAPLCSVSSYSGTGWESATMPPPTPK